MKIEVEGYTVQPYGEQLEIIAPDGKGYLPFNLCLDRDDSVIQHLQDKWYGKKPDIYEVAKEIESFVNRPKWKRNCYIFDVWVQGDTVVIPFPEGYVKNVAGKVTWHTGVFDADAS